MSDVVDAARALRPALRDAASTIERERRLPAAVVAAMVDTGIFRLCVPAALGGLETDAATLIEAIEAVAIGDGSAGWCAMIGATSGVIAAYLPGDAAREIYGTDPRVVTGGVFAPRGSATPADGGYTVDGRWSFASGCQHCDWLMGGCVVRGDGAVPPRMMLLPAHEVEIVDTWDTAGLRGTGSHDIVVQRRFVPTSRSVSLVADPPLADGALYRFPVFGLLALGIAGVALGVARAAVDELIRLAAEKRPSDGRRTLAERGVVQAEVARTEAAIGAARAYLFEQVAAAWDEARRGNAIPTARRTRLRLAATHAVGSAAAAIDAMYAAGGGTAIYAASPLQRCFRDVHTAAAHAMVAPATLELAGRLLLGLPTDTAML